MWSIPAKLRKAPKRKSPKAKAPMDTPTSTGEKLSSWASQIGKVGIIMYTDAAKSILEMDSSQKSRCQRRTCTGVFCVFIFFKF